MTEIKPTTKPGRLFGVRINWKIALAVSIPLALAAATMVIGSAVSGCSLNMSAEGIALKCKESE